MASWFRKLIQQVLLNKSFTPKMSSDATLKAKVRRKMVVGLGNTGMGGTRHCVGMAVLTALSKRLGASESWRSDKHVSGEVALSDMGDIQLILLRPRLLMNINGISVAKAAAKFRIPPEHIVLVHDELDKPLGKFSIKQGGSARGHNGVRSCIECLQTDVMPRLLIGIGRPAGKADVTHHVLGRFFKEEQKVLGLVLEKSVDLLLCHLIGADQQHPASPPVGRRASVKGKDLRLQSARLPAEGSRHAASQTDLNLQGSEGGNSPEHRTSVRLQCSLSPAEAGKGVDHRTDTDCQHSSSPSLSSPSNRSTT